MLKLKLIKSRFLIVFAAVIISFLSLIKISESQTLPICTLENVIFCEQGQCTPNYIPKFKTTASLENSPLYVKSGNNFIGYKTFNPTKLFDIEIENPTLALNWPNSLLSLLKISNYNNNPWFEVRINTNSVFAVDRNSSAVTGSSISWWARFTPLTSQPFSCPIYNNTDVRGAIYWQQGEGLCCCYSQGWRKCSNSQQPCVSVPTYTLTVNKAGSGSGTVTNTGINCGSDCSESFQQGAQVTLTATAASGSTFAGWQGCDSTNGNQCTVTMNSNKTVTATFNTTGGGGGSCTQNYLTANPSNPQGGHSTTISWSLSCQDNVGVRGVERRTPGGGPEESRTGDSGTWNQTFDAGITKTYCTYYYVGTHKYHGGNCINVTWGSPEVAEITSLQINGQGGIGSTVVVSGNSYTVSWSTRNASSCTLDGVNASVPNGSDVFPISNVCDSNADCDPNGTCTGTRYEDARHTLTCQPGNVSGSITARQRIRTCERQGGPPSP